MAEIAGIKQKRRKVEKQKQNIGLKTNKLCSNI